METRRPRRSQALSQPQGGHAPQHKTCCSRSPRDCEGLCQPQACLRVPLLRTKSTLGRIWQHPSVQIQLQGLFGKSITHDTSLGELRWQRGCCWEDPQGGFWSQHTPGSPKNTSRVKASEAFCAEGLRRGGTNPAHLRSKQRGSPTSKPPPWVASQTTFAIPKPKRALPVKHCTRSYQPHGERPRRHSQGLSPLRMAPTGSPFPWLTPQRGTAQDIPDTPKEAVPAHSLPHGHGGCSEVPAEQGEAARSQGPAQRRRPG